MAEPGLQVGVLAVAQQRYLRALYCLIEARGSATLSAQPLRSAESTTPATRINPTPYSQELGNPACAALGSAENATPATRTSPAPQTQEFNKPCPRSPSGVPKGRHSCNAAQPRAV